MALQPAGDDDDADAAYDNIRDPDLLGRFIGCVLVDVTQVDKDDLDRGEPNALMLHFDNGRMVTFYISNDGLLIEGEG